MLGVDPDPRTLRELEDMLNGWRMEIWCHTAILQAEIRNASPHRPKGDSGTRAKDLHPYLKDAHFGRGIPLTSETVCLLGAIVADPKKVTRWSASAHAKKRK